MEDKKKRNNYVTTWQLSPQEIPGVRVSLLITCVMAPKAMFYIKQSCTAQHYLQKEEKKTVLRLSIFGMM